MLIVKKCDIKIDNIYGNFSDYTIRTHTTHTSHTTRTHIEKMPKYSPVKDNRANIDISYFDRLWTKILERTIKLSKLSKLAKLKNKSKRLTKAKYASRSDPP